MTPAPLPRTFELPRRFSPQVATLTGQLAQRLNAARHPGPEPASDPVPFRTCAGCGYPWQPRCTTPGCIGQGRAHEAGVEYRHG
jgi:hypothetical protein